MLFTSEAANVRPDGHVGFVAGRYRNGAFSDLWTDVQRCADSTFTAYAAACSCGWRGPARPIDAIAIIACHRDWDRNHRAQLLAPTGPVESATSARVHRSVACVELTTVTGARVSSPHLGASPRPPD